MKEWLQKLTQLEEAQQWEEAIEFLIALIEHEPENKNAYISLLYLLFNLWLEEPHDQTKDPYYEQLMVAYFNESYKKFYTDAEYLFYAGSIVAVTPWLFAIESSFAQEMLKKALELEPHNIVFQWDLMPIIKGAPTKEMEEYANLVLQPSSPIIEELKSKGSLGQYFIRIMTYWSKRVLNQKVVRNDEVQS